MLRLHPQMDVFTFLDVDLTGVIGDRFSRVFDVVFTLAQWPFA